jgi:hypothetical protein
MVAPRQGWDTVTCMTTPSPRVVTTRSSRRHELGQRTDVLGSVASALEAGAAGDDWTVLEAWVLALTVVTWAALEAVPEELHDFL